MEREVQEGNRAGRERVVEDVLLEIVLGEGRIEEREAVKVRAVEWGGNCGASVQLISPVA